MDIFTEKDYKGEFNLNLMERNHIIKISKLVKHKRNTTALILGITERTLYNKLAQHNIENECSN
jgi:DNA-binding NtrC family response regulator